MSIFDAIGLGHRTHCVQKFKNIYDFSDDKIEYPVDVQVKEDGVYSIILVSDDVEAVYSRTGQLQSNIAHIEKPQEIGVYLAETVNPYVSLEELSGMVSSERVNPLTEAQQEINEHTSFRYHDYLTVLEFVEGVSKRKYTERHKSLTANVKSIKGKVLPYTSVSSRENLLKLADHVIDQGGEGIVGKQVNTGWKAGRKNHTMFKVVSEVSFDLECIGYETGKGKYSDKIANLIFRFKGGAKVKAMLGKGWTHTDAQDLLDAVMEEELNGVLQPSSPIGKIYRVKGLRQSSKNGLIRLPKVGERRDDKEEADY